MKVSETELALICIMVIAIVISITAIAMRVDKAAEIALGALNGMSLIGGWLGRGMIDKP
jgi:hypothetical protein